MGREPNLEDALRDSLQAARILSDGGWFAEALDKLRALAAGARDGDGTAPRVASALAAMARAAERGGDEGTAKGALETALALADWADLHLALGTRLAREDDRAGARRHCIRALEINPRYRAASVELALLDAREGNFGVAMSALRALTSGEGRTDEGLEEGLRSLREATLEDAEALLRSAVTGADPSLEALLARAREAFTAGNPDDGLAHLRTAALERPEYADTCALLGSHELRAGRLDDAIATLVQALELNPAFHAARLELARALEARGEREAALHEVGLVLEVEPAHVDAGALRDRLAGRRRTAAAARG